MKTFTVSILLITNLAHAEVKELASLNDLDRSALKGALVVMDIDNTLIRQNQMIGTHQWGDDMREIAIKRGMPEKEAREYQHRLFSEIQPLTRVLPVESSTKEFLDFLDTEQIPNFALTARPKYMTQATLRQIKTLNHDFAKSFPEQNDPHLMDAFLKNGVIFSGDKPKGELLLEIINNSKVRPTKIVFIDDKQYNVDSIEKSLAGSGIVLESYRYGAADPIVAAYDPKVADVEYSFFKEFNHLLTDQEAEDIMGDIHEFLDLRFQMYLAKQGPLAKNQGDCREVKEDLSYVCDYNYDNIQSSITFDFNKDPERGISFGF